MSISNVILNASPLICLCKSDLYDLLPRLFTNIVVSDVVRAEVMAKGTIDYNLGKIFTEGWLKKADIISIHPDIAAWGLGQGEGSVLSYAFYNRSYWAVIDDLEARRCAESMGCRYTGTVGILVLAKKKGIIPSVRECIYRLQDAGLWLSN
jgi:predicted nucleic acid-binding protein